MASGTANGCSFVATSARLAHVASTLVPFQIYAIRLDDEGKPYKVVFAAGSAWEMKSVPADARTSTGAPIAGETVHVFVGGTCKVTPACSGLGAVAAATRDASAP